MDGVTTTQADSSGGDTGAPADTEADSSSGDTDAPDDTEADSSSGDSGDSDAPVTTEAEPEAPEVPMFGNGPWPCGRGDASGETAQGVTDDTIIIGVGGDRGFPSSPGLNQHQTKAVLNFIDVCNSVGGINGRQIEAIEYDAAIVQAGTVMQGSLRSGVHVGRQRLQFGSIGRADSSGLRFGRSTCLDSKCRFWAWSFPGERRAEPG